jgi:hypothetical protein
MIITPDNIKTYLTIRAKEPEGRFIFDKVVKLFFSPDKPINVSYEICCNEIHNFESDKLYKVYRLKEEIEEVFQVKKITQTVMLDSILVHCFIDILIKYGFNIKITIPPSNPFILN